MVLNCLPNQRHVALPFILHLGFPGAGGCRLLATTLFRQTGFLSLPGHGLQLLLTLTTRGFFLLPLTFGFLLATALFFLPLAFLFLTAPFLLLTTLLLLALAFLLGLAFSLFPGLALFLWRWRSCSCWMRRCSSSCC